MPREVLHKLSAYRLEPKQITDIQIAGFNQVDAGTRTVEKTEFEYRLLFYEYRQNTASWYPAFSFLGLSRKLIPKTVNAGFVLLVRFNGVCYAVTGGVGHVHLRKTVAVTYQFGVELAKRLLSEDELRSLAQRDTGGAVNAIDRQFRGRYSPRQDVNNLRRILKAVRGQLHKSKNPMAKAIGSSIQGTDALSVNGEKSFPDILRFLSAVERVWQKGKDRIVIPSLERLSPKAHAPLISDLVVALVDLLIRYRPTGPQALFLESLDRSVFASEIVKWTLRSGRWHQEAHSGSELLELARDHLRASQLQQDRVDAFHALRLRIDFDDGSHEEDHFDRFVCGDVVHKNDSYFLDHRSWYYANEAYVQALTAQLNNIECIESTQLGLHEWTKSKYKDEDAFNASHKKHTLLDRRLVRVAGEQGIEFCDLLNAQDNRVFLIHVKEANGAELRALFAQGSVAGTLYSQDAAFRKLVHAADFSGRKKVAALSAKDKARLADLNNRQIREMTVVYAILDVTPSHTIANGATLTCDVFDKALSTFAKVDLLNHCQTLRGFGYTVALTRIWPIPARRTKR